MIFLPVLSPQYLTAKENNKQKSSKYKITILTEMCRFQGSGFVIVNENLFVTMASPLEMQKAFTGESAAAGMPTFASSAPFLLLEYFFKNAQKRK